MAITSLKEKNNKVAIGKVGKGFTKEQAPEALPIGPLAGGNPEREPPVAGTNEDLGGKDPTPSDWGAGDGANIESLITEEGGAISGGNFCGPVLRFEMKRRNKLGVTNSKINERSQFAQHKKNEKQ